MGRGPSIKKGDTVQVLTGKDRGRQGKVINVYPDRDKLMIEGVNMVKRHEPLRPAQGRGGMTGGIIQKEMPVHVSNVAIVCGSCDRPTRVGHEESPEGKNRICRKCGARL